MTYSTILINEPQFEKPDRVKNKSLLRNDFFSLKKYVEILMKSKATFNT